MRHVKEQHMGASALVLTPRLILLGWRAGIEWISYSGSGMSGLYGRLMGGMCNMADSSVHVYRCAFLKPFYTCAPHPGARSSLTSKKHALRNLSVDVQQLATQCGFLAEEGPGG